MAHFVSTIFAAMAPPLVGIATYALLRLRWRKRENDDDLAADHPLETFDLKTTALLKKTLPPAYFHRRPVVQSTMNKS